MILSPNIYDYDEIYLGDTMLDPKYGFICSYIVDLVTNTVQAPCLLAAHGLNTFTAVRLDDFVSIFNVCRWITDSIDMGAMFNIKQPNGSHRSIHINHINMGCSYRNDLQSTLVYKMAVDEYLTINMFCREVHCVRGGQHHLVSALPKYDPTGPKSAFCNVVGHGEGGGKQNIAIATRIDIHGTRSTFSMDISDINECRQIDVVPIPYRGWAPIMPKIDGGPRPIVATESLYHVDLRAEGKLVRICDTLPAEMADDGSATIIDEDLVALSQGYDIIIYSIKSGRILNKVVTALICDTNMAEW